MSKKIVVIGAGPTGLGAAYRLSELEYEDWEIYERSAHIGGLCASFLDEKGFTWDIGGHVLFSRHPYVDRLVDRLLGDEYLLHRRDAWIWALGRWVPYPFQNNIRHLPRSAIMDCLMGLIEAWKREDESDNFHDWIVGTYGKGIAEHFMLPVNRKSWAYPLTSMAKTWAAQTVSRVNIESALKSIVYNRDQRDWGPNSEFRFPSYGGTGGLFMRFMPYLEGHLTMSEEMLAVNVDTKTVRFASGRETPYDVLINTAPLDRLVASISPREDFLARAAEALQHSGVLSVGVGIGAPSSSTRSWVYFPEDDCCFYRVTYFSNYSPNNVPDPRRFHSLMCETSYSSHKAEDKATVGERTVNGLISAGLLKEADRASIESIQIVDAEYAYPIPTVGRDDALAIIEPYLEANSILSRGRFGAWRYERSSMDQSIMQGVEAVNRVLRTNGARHREAWLDI